MNINNSFPSKYIKSGDITDDDLVVTISRVAIESLGQGDKAEDKPIVYFSDNEKGLVLNKTNAHVISDLYGPETDAWVGKKIALYATEVEMGGVTTLGIRVRLRAPGAKPLPAKFTAPAPVAAPSAIHTRTEAVAALKESIAEAKTALVDLDARGMSTDAATVRGVMSGNEKALNIKGGKPPTVDQINTARQDIDNAVSAALASADEFEKDADNQ